MNEENVTVRHDISIVDGGVDVIKRVDESKDGSWKVAVQVVIESNGELHRNGSFRIPKEAKSVEIDFGSQNDGRDKSVKFCTTEKFDENTAIELAWDYAKIYEL